MAKKRKSKKSTTTKNNKLRSRYDLARRIALDSQKPIFNTYSDLRSVATAQRKAVKRQLTKFSDKLPYHKPGRVYYSQQLTIDQYLQGLKNFKIAVCKARKTRTQVLHALKKTGTGNSRKPVFNEKSKLKC